MINSVERGKNDSTYSACQSRSVTVENEKVSEISEGFLILLGVFDKDTDKEAALLAKKTVNLRIFTDENGKMNLSPANLRENGKECEFLVVSQFTLCAMCKGQNRPSFIPAAFPDAANELYEKYVSMLRNEYESRASKRRTCDDYT